MNRPQGQAPTFQYRARSAASVEARAKQQGGLYDNPLVSNLPVFTTKSEGQYHFRILPNMAENAEHWGIDVYVHQQVGADNQTYLCPAKMLGQPCPICEEQKDLERAGDTEAAKNFKTSKKVLFWIIDRKAEEAGPKLWLSPWTIDRDIALLCKDPASGEILMIDHWDEGYDVFFEKQGTKFPNIKYTGFQLARRSTALANDIETQNAWLQFVSDNPLLNTLNYYDYDHMKGSLMAAPKAEVATAAEPTQPAVQPRRPTASGTRPVTSRPPANPAPMQAQDQQLAEDLEAQAQATGEIDDPNASLDDPNAVPVEPQYDDTTPPAEEVAVEEAPFEEPVAEEPPPVPVRPTQPVRPAPARSTAPATSTRPAAPSVRPVAPQSPRPAATPNTAPRPTGAPAIRPITSPAPVARPQAPMRTVAPAATAPTARPGPALRPVAPPAARPIAPAGPKPTTAPPAGDLRSRIQAGLPKK